jgi:uncharacterized phage protein gp47/JayE
MPLSFEPATGLHAPDTGEIRESVARDWQDAFHEDGKVDLDVDPSAPAGQLVDAETAEIEAKNAELLYLANQFNPRVAEGRWQDALGYIYFLRRKKDEPTVVVCRVTGAAGTVVPYGAVVRNDDGHTLICNRSVAVGEDGTAETTFRCVRTGPIDIAAGSVNSIVTVTPGWDTVGNAEAGVAGRDLETRADFEARRYASVAMNAHGSTAALYGALNNLSGFAGVIDVQVLENIGPDPVVKYGVTVPGHGVTICIFGGQDTDIARIIYEKKDAGCDTGGNTEVSHAAPEYAGALYTYRILRPKTVNFWVRVTLAGSDAPLSPAVVQAIRNAVLSDFRGENPHTLMPRVGLAQTVYAARFVHAVTALPGVVNLLTVGIALGTDEPSDYASVIDIRGDQEPVMSADNISIVEA